MIWTSLSAIESVVLAEVEFIGKAGTQGGRSKVRDVTQR